MAEVCTVMPVTLRGAHGSSKFVTWCDGQIWRLRHHEDFHHKTFKSFQHSIRTYAKRLGIGLSVLTESREPLVVIVQAHGRRDRLRRCLREVQLDARSCGVLIPTGRDSDHECTGWEWKGDRSQPHP